jgi:hypothetical protein
MGRGATVSPREQLSYFMDISDSGGGDHADQTDSRYDNRHPLFVSIHASPPALDFLKERVQFSYGHGGSTPPKPGKRRIGRGRRAKDTIETRRLAA